MYIYCIYFVVQDKTPRKIQKTRLTTVAGIKEDSSLKKIQFHSYIIIIY